MLMVVKYGLIALGEKDQRCIYIYHSIQKQFEESVMKLLIIDDEVKYVSVKTLDASAILRQ